MNKSPEVREKKFDWVRFVVWSFFFIFIIFLVIGTVESSFECRPPRGPGCEGNLRNLGIIITNYSTDYKGHYPQNLDVLVEHGYINELPTCPLTDKSYTYEVDGWDSEDFTVWCPNPEDHIGTSGPKSVTASLYYYSGLGVIQVDKESE